MEKVKISREQADAIVHARTEYSDVDIIEAQFDPAPWTAGRDALDGVPVDTVIRALYIGYEVEMTVEEKILNAYEKCGKNEYVDSWDHPENKRAYRQGIAIVCDILEMEIKGVNDRQLG